MNSLSGRYNSFIDSYYYDLPADIPTSLRDKYVAVRKSTTIWNRDLAIAQLSSPYERLVVASMTYLWANTNYQAILPRVANISNLTTVYKLLDGTNLYSNKSFIPDNLKLQGNENDTNRTNTVPDYYKYI